ncbi:MAG: hypothetical protein WCD42_03530 [Rhizomicrobium sp.]
MKSLVRMTMAVAALGAAALFATPASAGNFAIGVGPGGVNFSLSSGGYCDAGGCPDAFWDMPVYYCPVFYHGDWYRGPVYYRRGPGGPEFWIRGKWRRDGWNGPRPGWACNDRFGPALGFEYYDKHGFHMRDDWRARWGRDHHMPAGPHFGPDRFGPDRHGPDNHGPDRGPDHGGPAAHGPDRGGPALRGPDNRGPDKHGDAHADKGGDKGHADKGGDKKGGDKGGDKKGGDKGGDRPDHNRP